MASCSCHMYPHPHPPPLPLVVRPVAHLASLSCTVTAPLTSPQVSVRLLSLPSLSPHCISVSPLALSSPSLLDIPLCPHCEMLPQRLHHLPLWAPPSSVRQPHLSRSEVWGKAGRPRGSGPGLWVRSLQGPHAPSPEPLWGRGGSPLSLQLQVLPMLIRDVGSEVFKALLVISEASVCFIYMNSS